MRAAHQLALVTAAAALAAAATVVISPSYSWVTFKVVPIGLISSQDATRAGVRLVGSPHDGGTASPVVPSAARLVLCVKQGYRGGYHPYSCPGPGWFWAVRFRDGSEVTVDAHTGSPEGGLFLGPGPGGF